MDKKNSSQLCGFKFWKLTLSDFGVHFLPGLDGEITTFLKASAEIIHTFKKLSSQVTYNRKSDAQQWDKRGNNFKSTKNSRHLVSPEWIPRKVAQTEKELTFNWLLLSVRTSRFFRNSMSSGTFVSWFVPKFKSTIWVHVRRSAQSKWEKIRNSCCLRNWYLKKLKNVLVIINVIHTKFHKSFCIYRRNITINQRKCWSDLCNGNVWRCQWVTQTLEMLQSKSKNKLFHSFSVKLD